MSEDLKKKFQLLSEYAFIKDKSYEQDQFQGALFEDDEEEDPLADFGDEMGNNDDSQEEGPEKDGDMGGDENQEPEGEGSKVDPAVEPQPGEEDKEDSDDPFGDFPVDDLESDDEMGGESEGGDVELDVTELVQGSEEAKASADEANQKIDQLLSSIDQLLQASEKIDALGQRMADIENEIVKRNPTKEEKLEMQSLHSAPYTVKLGDYWADKADYIEDVAKTGPTFNDIDQPKQEPEEMTLTQADVDRSYSEMNVKNSFDYEEDEVDDYMP